MLDSATSHEDYFPVLETNSSPSDAAAFSTGSGYSPDNGPSGDTSRANAFWQWVRVVATAVAIFAVGLVILGVAAFLLLCWALRGVHYC